MPEPIVVQHTLVAKPEGGVVGLKLALMSSGFCFLSIPREPFGSSHGFATTAVPYASVVHLRVHLLRPVAVHIEGIRLVPGDDCRHEHRARHRVSLPGCQAGAAGEAIQPLCMLIRPVRRPFPLVAQIAQPFLPRSGCRFGSASAR